MFKAVLCVLPALSLAVSLTKTPDVAGVTQFWTDDYKVFEQIYGKTSDRQLYGATLPPSISYGVDASKLGEQASEKKERYLFNAEPTDDEDAYDFGAKYSSLLPKPTKKPKNHLKFIPAADFKPISQNNDPETYNYLKRLELLQKQNSDLQTDVTVSGFKPYVSYTAANAEDTEAYKSIQDILDAHEANKGKKHKEYKDEDESVEQVKYANYGGTKGRSVSKKYKPRIPSSSKTKPRCSGPCRKRAITYRVYTRPYVRRIKHKIISY